MKRLFYLFLLFAISANGQSDQKVLKWLKRDVAFLANDKLEGRRTGTVGEKLAAEYLMKTFEAGELLPQGNKNDLQKYYQPFNVFDGLKQSDSNQFSIDNRMLIPERDFSPLAYGADADVRLNNPTEEIMLFDLKTKWEESKSSPHVDFENEVYESCLAISKTHDIKILILFNSADSGLSLVFDSKNKREKLPIPVVYVKKDKIGLFSDAQEKAATIVFRNAIISSYRVGTNVIGMINNGADQTIVLGAHFDHLGYGEDHNSLYAGAEPMIHHGADDNASGTAALISLSKILKKRGDKRYNYLFVAFSGEELGLYGSKYFAENPTIPLSSVKYMINMDMVGRLNDSTNAITIGGFGTSPSWGKIIDMHEQGFTIKVDSSGSGPSDHTSFYKKNIPVLFFFTGTHSDYHKPSDLPEKINYNGILKIVKLINIIITKSLGEEMVFTKTREVSVGKSSFKVTMGIMPDYTYSGDGVLVEGVSENKPAKKAGIISGDVVIQLGEHRFSDVQGYMKALNKFNKGETTTVKLKRGEQTIELTITF